MRSHVCCQARWLFNCLTICSLTADDGCPEADQQQEGAGAADGFGQPGCVLEPAGPAEWFNGSRRPEPVRPAGALPAAPRTPWPPSRHREKPRALQGPLRPRNSSPNPTKLAGP